MKTYDPRDWYWQADDGRVFASARRAVVTADDAAFAAWRADGSFATVWPRDDAGAQSNAALDAVLLPQDLSVAGPVRTATTYQLMSALTDAQREAYPAAKPWDQRLFSARDTPWPESNPKILRIADALKTTPAAWFDAALTPAAG